MMRTTVNLPDDLSDLIRSVAAARGVTLGAAIEQLVRRGLRADSTEQRRSKYPTFAVSPDDPPITLEHTLAIEDEL